MLTPSANKSSRVIAAFWLAALFCLYAGPAAAKGPFYNILYVSRPDQAGINSARAGIVHILGPDVASRLRVLRRGGMYGLVYVRHGDLGSAAAVARSHARMLARHGLQAPVPVKAQDWDAAPPAAPEKTVPVKAAPKTGPAVQAAAPVPQPAAPAMQLSPAQAPDLLPFEARIDLYLKHLRDTGGIKKDERTAWAIYDLTDNAKLAGVNEDMLLQTASLVKPFVALAYFHEVSLGRQQYTAAAKKHMEEMIRDSDNASADWFMRLLGGPAAVERLLKLNYGGMLHDLDLVEYIPRNGHTYRNKASVRDYTAFLNALWNDTLPSAAEIKRVMCLTKRNRLSTGGVPQSTEVYDKTGTTSHLCGDMGILVALRDDGKRFPYIVIGLIQKTSPASRYFSWMHNRGDIIRHVSAMAYEEMALRHHFRDFNSVSAAPALAAAGQDKVVTASAEAIKPDTPALSTGTQVSAPAAKFGVGTLLVN